jgi:hypothetical protein
VIGPDDDAAAIAQRLARVGRRGLVPRFRHAPGTAESLQPARVGPSQDAPKG